MCRTNSPRFYIRTFLHVFASFHKFISYCYPACTCHLRTKLSTEDQGEILVVVVASRASTRQYQVPFGSVAVQLVPACQLDEVLIVENDELLLTCTRYWIEPPLGFVDGFHWSPIAHPEYEEQEPSGSATRTGAVGGLVLVGADSVKLPAADQAEILVVVTESRA